MIKKYSLVFLAILCFVLSGFGQILTYEFSGLSGNEVSATSNFNNANLTTSNITRGLGLTASVNGGRFNATDWALTSIANAVTGNNYMEFTITPNATYQFSVSSIFINLQRSGTGPSAVALRSSLDGYSTNLDTEYAITNNTSTQAFTFTFAQANSTSPVTYRFYMYAESTGGSGGIGDGTGNDIIVNGTVTSSCTPPANPSGAITGTSPSCSNTTLTYTGTDTTPLLLLNYWQTSATGTDTSNDATGTYNATASGTYYVRKYDVTADCWSANAVSRAVVINTTPTISTQPQNRNIAIGNNTTFNVVASNAYGYQWQVSTNGGTIWNSLTNGAPYSNVTTNTLNITNVTLGMHNNLYRCVVSGNVPCGSVNSASRVLTVFNSPPSNATQLGACIGNTSINLNWTNSSSGATGYIVFAQPNATIPFMAAASAGNADDYIANGNYTLATTYGTLGRAVYKGNLNTASITGLTNGTDYTFKVVAYNGNTLTGWAGGINSSGSWNDTYTIDTPSANITSASVAPTSSVLSWTNPLPTSCYEILIIANQGSATTFSPAGDGSGYVANATYGGADSFVFKGNGITTTVTGLTDGLPYCYTIFVRNVNTNDWSRGNTICQTTGLSYCSTSSGGTSTNSGILNVQLNTINNASASTNDYTDFTGVSTTLELGQQYNLGVNVNTGGNYTSHVKVWIDWNRDGSFNNSSNEAIELGTLNNSTNGQPSFSPLSIVVPYNAVIGNVRMRVSSKSDNSEPYATPCEDFSYGEVEDYTINIIRPNDPDIHLEGNIGFFPDITGDGTNVPSGIDNTLFATNFIGNSEAKSFRIINEGIATLNLSNISIGGSHPGDFTITGTPPAYSIPLSNIEILEITFSPLASGTRTATVEISSNDSDEDPFIFNIQGTGECNIATYSLSPSTGPAGTIVTVITTSGSNPNSATALYDGSITTVTNISASEFEITIPNNAISSNISFNDITGCARYLPFTVITTDISDCEGSGSLPSDIFISEVTDRDSSVDGHSYIELFNGTGAPVNISNYIVEVHSNGNSWAGGIINIPNGTTLANDDTYVISFGTGNNNVDPVGQNDYFSSNTIGINDSDHLILNDGSTDIDLWGDTSGNPFTGGVGTEYNGTAPNGSDYTYRRKNSGITAPSMIWNSSDWILITPLNYSDIGNYDFSVGVPPTVTLEPIAPISTCDLSAVLTIDGTEGFDPPTGDTADLTFQWFYNAPGTNFWVEILSSNSAYTGQQSNELTIINTLNLNGYQYYCQAREDTVTCYKASNAIKLHVERTTWDGTNWTPNAPDEYSIAVIDGTYDTNLNGDIDACQLIINSGVGNSLNVANSTYVRIVNNVINNGTITVQTHGALVQDGVGANAGTFTNNGIANVMKQTSNFFDDGFNYHYTYWSSPVVNADITAVFPNPRGNRRFYFETANYLDQHTDGTTNGIPDEIDDDGNDWQVATGFMEVGRGYAITATSPPGFPYNNTNQFSGAYNTGDITKSILINGFVGDNDWNFIGNPYPSAIDFNLLYNFGSNSTIIDGAAFLWSQSAPPEIVNPGNEVLNFNQSDYAIISAGSGNIAGGAVGLPPNDFIPSGQGFFVKGLSTNSITFNNNMRMRDNSSNNVFYRTNNGSETLVAHANRLWVNLTSDNGIFSQLLIAYVDGATNAKDNWSYDVPRNMSTGLYATFYSLIENENDKFAIQGKLPESLTLNEIISIGFNTTITVPTLYKFSIAQLDGGFMNENTVYLKDKLLNIIHDLSANDYSFTSETGEFNNRFEIVFRDSFLSINEEEVSGNNVTIIEHPNGEVQFTVPNTHEIKSIQIIDLLGRTIYQLKGSSHSETYDLSNLSQATYIAKITLTDGQVISKKAVKRK